VALGGVRVELDAISYLLSAVGVHTIAIAGLLLTTPLLLSAALCRGNLALR
jgi:hypothetical protein